MVCRPSPYDVATFRDALGLALELSAYHPEGHFALLTDNDHRAVHLLAHLDGRGPHRSVAINLADEQPERWSQAAAQGGSLLVISIDEPGRLGFHHRHQSVYFACRQALARHRLVLRDWIRTDGEELVSAAYAWHPTTAWSDDPSPVRRADQAMFATDADP